MYEETQQRLASDLKEVGFSQLQLICGAVLLVSGIFRTWCVTLASNVQLETKCLQTLYFPADHTAENVSETLQDTYLGAVGLRS